LTGVDRFREQAKMSAEASQPPVGVPDPEIADLQKVGVLV
jgi:hypothetical protein